MHCTECRDLHRNLKAKMDRYEEARSSAFFQVSTKIAVRRHMDMLRAHNDLLEHQSACPWAAVADSMVHVLDRYEDSCRMTVSQA
jgi:hypothetical protein